MYIFWEFAGGTEHKLEEMRLQPKRVQIKKKPMK
jgi:hypothetical protein